MKLLLLAAAVLLVVLFAAAAFPADFSGLTVTRIILHDDFGNAWPAPESLMPLLAATPGAPFSKEDIRKGIGYLYLKGAFRDVRVDAFPEEGGVRLEYTLVPITVVEKIVLRGNHSLPDRAVREAMAGVEGKELREDAFPDIRANIQERYQAEGFYNVRVNFRHEPAPTPHREILFVEITEPKQTIIEDIRFKDNTVFAEKDLLDVMKSKKGRPLRTDVLFDTDLDAVLKKYVGAGYPAAKPGPVSISFHDDKAVLEIGGTEGPRVTVSFAGNRTFCAEQFPDLLGPLTGTDKAPAVLDDLCAGYFRSLLLIWTEHDVSDAVVESSVEKIRDVYRERGFVDVNVEVKKTEGPGTMHLEFEIQEGLRVSVDEVRIEGNTVFTASQIRDMMATRGSGWFRSRPYREDVLDNDIDVITDQYVAAGYLAAEVKKTVTRIKNGRRVLISLKIAEGRQTLTGYVSFEGNSALTSADLSAGLKLKSGMPFSERMMEEDRYRILSLYSGKGYLYAVVEAERKPAFAVEPAGGKEAAERPAGPEVVNVNYRITEDNQVRIGRVILRGNTKTRDYVILRELLQKTGDPYRYEDILTSQQRIYRYGYFSQARFEPVNPGEKEYVKDMLFTVEERPAGAVEFGAGYGDLDRLRGFVEVSHRNLWGTARYASFRVEGSDILRRAAFTFQEPWFLGHRLDSRFTLAWSDRKNINQDTREIYYQTRKTTASYGVEKTMGDLKTSLTYQFENVDNYNVKPQAQLSPEDSGRVRISSLSPGIVLDKRDDPFNPRTGGIHGILIKEAMKELGSQADFTKATVQTTWFFSASDYATIALSGRAGMAWPHHDTPEVPIHERFYLGGSTTVRGYTQDSVGPFILDASGTRVPTGGSSMVQFNAEFRLNSAGGGGVVLFTDAGNVWVDQDIRLDDLRASYGLGLRYHTPVGPLRLDYGQKIHRRPGESPGELHFNIGHAF